MASMQKTMCAVGLAGWLLTAVTPVWSQEYAPVETKDLKAAPQRFWAKGVVFRDTLKEHPGTQTLKLEDRSIVTRFSTEILGDVYATKELVSEISNLPVGSEYFFSGTVSQRGRKLFLLGSRKYVYVVKAVEEVKADASLIPEKLKNLNAGSSDNPYNRVFIALESVMAEVEKDLVAYATTQGIEVNKMFDVEAGHFPKVTSSIYTALRKAEDRSKIPSQEFLVSLIASMMALQSGYVETTPAAAEYVPEAAPQLDELVEEITGVKEEPGPEISKEAWDLSNTPEAVEESAPVAETVTVIEPAADAAVTNQPAQEETPKKKKSRKKKTEEAPASTETISEPVPETPAEEIISEPAPEAPAAE